MKKLSFILGILSLMLFMGFASATSFNCNSCSSCNTTINTASTGDIIRLNTSITGDGSSDCITDYVANVILDCQGFYINGNGAFNGIFIKSGTNNVTITNCNIQNWNSETFAFGIVSQGNETKILNSNVSYNTQGFSLGNNLYYMLISNSTFSHNKESFLVSSNSIVQDSVFDANIGSSTYGEGVFIRGNNNTIRNCVFKNSFSSDFPNGYNPNDDTPSILSGLAMDDNSPLGTADYNVITNCTFMNNSNGFMSLPYTNPPLNTVINDSTFINNGKGIVMIVVNGQNPINSMIYNNFFNNTANLLVDDYVNYFNTTISNITNIIGGTQIGGNFWGTPNGTGYSQTCDNLNNDSFCDSPFSITALQTDYLPLTNNYSEEPVSVFDITWLSPATNGSTVATNQITWTVNISEAPTFCNLSINGSANISMTIDGSTCTYTSMSLTNQTTYCGQVFAGDADNETNVSTTQCATTAFHSPTPPAITWVSPSNNSFTQNSSTILWNASLNQTPVDCLITINGSANQSMLKSGQTCYFTSLNLTNGTKYCAIIYANDSFGDFGMSGLQCATINLTSITPIPPKPPLINNLGIFSFVAGITIGAGLLMFLLEALYGNATLLRNPKNLAALIIGALIMASVISVLFV